jgi:hypothetical protein
VFHIQFPISFMTKQRRISYRLWPLPRLFPRIAGKHAAQIPEAACEPRAKEEAVSKAQSLKMPLP